MKHDFTEAAAQAASSVADGLASKGMAANFAGATTIAVSANASQWHWWTSDTAAWVGMLVGAIGVLGGLWLHYQAHLMRVAEDKRLAQRHAVQMTLDAARLARLQHAALDQPTEPGPL